MFADAIRVPRAQISMYSVDENKLHKDAIRVPRAQINSNADGKYLSFDKMQSVYHVYEVCIYRVAQKKSHIRCMAFLRCRKVCDCYLISCSRSMKPS